MVDENICEVPDGEEGQFAIKIGPSPPPGLFQGATDFLYNKSLFVNLRGSGFPFVQNNSSYLGSYHKSYLFASVV